MGDIFPLLLDKISKGGFFMEKQIYDLLRELMFAIIKMMKGGN